MRCFMCLASPVRHKSPQCLLASRLSSRQLGEVCRSGQLPINRLMFVRPLYRLAEHSPNP